jgi:tetratricopeptide (TPR) repeat protein
MQKSINDENRRVIPRWRTYTSLPRTELSGIPESSSVKIDIEEEFAKFKQNIAVDDTDYYAISLLNFSKAFNFGEGIEYAKKSVKSFSQIRPSAFVDHALRKENEFGELRKQIHNTRNQIISSPSNSLSYLRLALLYTSVAQRRSAIRAMNTALSASKYNRYFMRSAARCFVHFGEFELASNLFDKNYDKNDPWLQSANLSIQHMTNNLSKVEPKLIRRLLTKDVHKIHLVELALGYATLELENGAIKKARKLINQFRTDLNENTAAQLKWIEEKYKLDFEFDLKTVHENHEASTRQYYLSNDWHNAVAEAERWQMIEEFSSRPSVLSSYILIAYLENYNKAIQHIDRALISNPNNFALKNNKAFAQSKLGKVSEATNTLRSITQSSLNDNENTIYLATSAHTALSIGDYQKAVAGYADAFKSARRNNSLHTREFLLLHFYRELGAKENLLSVDEKHEIASYFSADGNARRESKNLYQHIQSELSIHNAINNDFQEYQGQFCLSSVI